VVARYERSKKGISVPAYDHRAGGRHSIRVDVEKLWKLRVNQGFTQRELARKAGISNATLSKIEHGRSPRPPTLKKLADVLGVEPVDLLLRR
jgi:DNA-binding Xre family transcriptional regulator